MKLDKPLEEEMARLLEDIPDDTSASLSHRQQHRHHHAIPMPHAPIIAPYHHPIYGRPAHPSSDPSSSSSSSSSPHSNDEVNTLDLLTAFQFLNLRPDSGPTSNPNPNANYLSPNPYPLLYQSQTLLRRCSQSPFLPPGLRNTNLDPLRPALYDDSSFILEGRGANYTNTPYSNKKRSDYVSNLVKFENLVEIPGYIYYAAKDQSGCRLLQRKFDEGRRQDVDKIFNGIIGHIADLMMNPFGNYLVQKLLDVCTEEQRMRIVLKLTQDPLEIIRVSLNTHGTRAVQKLIETLKTQQQIRLVVSALKPGFLNLIKDLNGNHVVQRCLQSLSAEDNKFIFDAAAKHCVEIATHRHGCCVLQRCITYSRGEYRAHLVDQISANALLLAQDAFGNYVVQFILDLKNPSVAANLASQFEGNYVQLSTQKFSSNVVEKCLKLFADNHQARIVFELLTVPRFEMLLQDPYANYVIQSALSYTEGPVKAALVNAIHPHAAVLRTSPYCKRIFSRTQLKK